MNRTFITLVTIGCLLLSPISQASTENAPCDLTAFQEALQKLNTQKGFFFKRWVKSHTEELEWMFDQLDDTTTFWTQAQQKYKTSSSQKLKNRLIFTTKLSGFVAVMYLAAYLQSFLPDGPAQHVVTAAMGALLFGLLHPILGPILESLYNSVRLNSFRSITGKNAPVDEKLLESLDSVYKRANATFNDWQRWSRDDLSFLLIRFEQHLTRFITLYSSYLLSRQIAAQGQGRPAITKEHFHEPLADALITIAELYPDYAAKPTLVLDFALPKILKASYFQITDLDMDMLRKIVQRKDKKANARKVFYEQAYAFIAGYIPEQL